MTTPYGTTTPLPAAEPASPATPSLPQVWLDPEPLRPSWRAPQRRGRWRWPVLALVLLLIAAGVGVGLAGGFGTRTDDRIVVAPGTVVETGLYQLQFTSATAYRVVDPRTKEVRQWLIRVVGTGRTTGDRSGSPSSSWMAIGRSGTGVAEDGTVYQVGGLAEIGADFQPQMPMTTFVIGATFPKEWTPDGQVNVIMSRAELRNNSASGSSSGLVYVPGRQYYYWTLPMNVVDGYPD